MSSKTTYNLALELEAFLNLLTQVKSDYAWSVEEESRLEALSQDYLHLLELQDTDSYDMAQAAAELRLCRIDRRAAKDTQAQLKPMVEFLESEKGKMAVSQLRQVLGSTRKAEKTILNRRYTPRVLESEYFSTGTPGVP